jgi:hypothetical protein
MFSKLEKKIIIMALMYIKNDYTQENLEDLGIDDDRDGWDKFEATVQVLIEDFIGPTWDEEAKTAPLKTETAKRTRH